MPTNAILSRDPLQKTSSEASASIGDTSAEFDMEPNVIIEEEDYIDPPMPITPRESTEEWLARIDAEWEVRRLQLQANFVPTYQPITTTWLTLGCSDPLLASLDPTNNVEGFDAPIDHVDEHEPLVEHTIQQVRPDIHSSLFCFVFLMSVCAICMTFV